MKSLCFCLPIRPVGVWGPYKIDVLLSSLNRLLLLPARTRRLIIIPCPQLLHSTPLLFARRITHLGLGRSPVCGIAPTAERRIGSPGNAARISNRLREGKSEGLRVGRRWGWNEQGGRCKEIGDMFLVVQNLDPGDEQKCCATQGRTNTYAITSTGSYSNLIITAELVPCGLLCNLLQELKPFFWCDIGILDPVN